MYFREPTDVGRIVERTVWMPDCSRRQTWTVSKSMAGILDRSILISNSVLRHASTIWSASILCSGTGQLGRRTYFVPVAIHLAIKLHRDFLNRCFLPRKFPEVVVSLSRLKRKIARDRIAMLTLMIDSQASSAIYQLIAPWSMYLRHVLFMCFSECLENC